MKKIFVTSLVLLLCRSAQAQSTIVADVTNFKNNNGVCRACLFDNAAAFRGERKPLQCVQVPVAHFKAQVIFDHVPPGTYAISLFHDANNNQQLDKNFLGIPKEGYGASRNNLPFAAAPGFEANKFTLNDHSVQTLEIRLRNL